MTKQEHKRAYEREYAKTPARKKYNREYQREYTKQRKRRLKIEAAGCEPSRCEACGKGLRYDTNLQTQGESAAWDHNHETGTFRGWLCKGCNSALGHAGDNPKILDKLATYLRTRGFAVRRPVIS